MSSESSKFQRLCTRKCFAVCAAIAVTSAMATTTAWANTYTIKNGQGMPSDMKCGDTASILEDYTGSTCVGACDTTYLIITQEEDTLRNACTHNGGSFYIIATGETPGPNQCNSTLFGYEHMRQANVQCNCARH
jgi:benzoyl-CoA reductase/2-hydroxyglutaryl-CoA dehydratase subunit BcrC/BadD/HgdB